MSVKKTAAKKSAPRSSDNKPVPEKPPAKGPGAPSAAAADADVHATAYTLPALVARLATGPTVTADQVMIYVDVPPEQLVAEGQSISTERINVDSARIYGTAYDFFQVATPQQRAAVPGLTMQRLRISIWAAAQGEAKNQAARAAEERGAAQQSYRAIEARQIKDKGRGVRDVLYVTLFALAGGQKLRVDELRVAYGRFASPQDLATSLGALADLYDRYMSDPDPKIVARRAEMTLDGALSKQGRAVAEQVLARGSAVKAPRTATSNAEVDLWDGYNLHLLDQLITIFEAGHLLDPTVPRLLPLSLRGWFGRSRSTKPTAPAPTPEPAQPSA